MPELVSTYGSLPEESPPWILDELPTVASCAISSRELVIPARIMKHVESSKEFRKVCSYNYKYQLVEICLVRMYI